MTTCIQIDTMHKAINAPVTDESAFWHIVGKELVDMTVDYFETDGTATQATVSLNSSFAYFNVSKRGTYIDDNGAVRPSIHIHPVGNSIDLATADYPKAELRCINGRVSSDGRHTANNYKKYVLGGGSNTTHTNTYGRIGDANGRWGDRDVQYPSYTYWVLYYEKLSKGYKDYSKYLNDEPVVAPSSKKSPPKSVNERLYAKLQRYANFVASRVYSEETVTRAQVTECRRLWGLLGQQTTVADFNAVLSDIMCLVPRYVSDVRINGYARSSGDFKRIVIREDEYINALESRVDMNKPTKTERFTDTEVYVATAEQKAKVLARIPSGIEVVEIYRIIDHKQKSKFDTYCKNNHIKQVKEFWHGSKRCNWLSIVKQGLSLNPNAQITGKMLGNGCYFAPSFTKSYRYLDGGYWGGGHSGTGFLGLYAVAYGNPLEITSASRIRSYTASELTRDGYNCVHAIGGTSGLRDDEICVYDESAMLLNFLVEVKN